MFFMVIWFVYICVLIMLMLYNVSFSKYEKTEEYNKTSKAVKYTKDGKFLWIRYNKIVSVVDITESFVVIEYEIFLFKKCVVFITTSKDR
jgi:hypothetical protein